MNIVFYVFLTMSAVYLIFHIKESFCWWLNVILIVPKAMWYLILKLFGKR